MTAATARTWRVTADTRSTAASTRADADRAPSEHPPTPEEDCVVIGWGEARKHRQRLRSRAGRDVLIDLPRGSFLAHDDMLWSDEELALRVTRPPEPAVVVDFADNPGVEAFRSALLLGYAWGNQHAPLDMDATQVRVPLLVGEATAVKTLRDLGLVGRVCSTRIAARGWWTTSADHREGHSHDQGTTLGSVHAPASSDEQHHVHEHGSRSSP